MALTPLIAQNRKRHNIAVDGELVATHRVTVQGSLLRVKCLLPGQQVVAKSVGQINDEFSPGSRNRLLERMACVDWSRAMPADFITLTFRDDFPTDPDSMHTAQSRFFKHYEEQNGHWPVLWRREWKRRKTGVLVGQPMPHYHLITMGGKLANESEVYRSWSRANKTLVGAIVDIDKMETTLQCAKYVAKYCGKQTDASSLVYAANWKRPCGRAWGIRRRLLVPWATVVSLQLTDLEQLHNLRTYSESVWKGLSGGCVSTWKLFLSGSMTEKELLKIIAGEPLQRTAPRKMGSEGIDTGERGAKLWV